MFLALFVYAAEQKTKFLHKETHSTEILKKTLKQCGFMTELIWMMDEVRMTLSIFSNLHTALLITTFVKKQMS